MAHGIDIILAELKLSSLAPRVFEGYPNNWPNRHVFGGHLVAQAMEAASLTLSDNYYIHAVKADFLRPGKFDQIIKYSVIPVRESRNFQTFQITACQKDTVIFIASVSIHKREKGLNHQSEIPFSIPRPESLENDEDYYARTNPTDKSKSRNSPFSPFDVRSIDRMDQKNPQAKSGITGHWFKLKQQLVKNLAENSAENSDQNAPQDCPPLHSRLLAYCSDYGLLSSNLRPHAITLQKTRFKTVTSLDHSIWFTGADFRIDNWIFYQTEGFWAGQGRGLAKGTLFTSSGTIIASTMQDSLLRLEPDA